MSVEKLLFRQNSRNLGDGKCLAKRRLSFVGLPIAKFFRPFSCEAVFQQPRLVTTADFRFARHSIINRESGPPLSQEACVPRYNARCCRSELRSLKVSLVQLCRPVEFSQVTFDGGTFLDDGASWSPQGDAIVFQRQDVKAGTNGIYVLSSDGKQIRLILERPASAFRPLRPKQIKNLSRMRGQKSLIQIENGGFQPRWGAAQ